MESVSLDLETAKRIAKSFPYSPAHLRIAADLIDAPNLVLLRCRVERAARLAVASGASLEDAAKAIESRTLGDQLDEIHAQVDDLIASFGRVGQAMDRTTVSLSRLGELIPTVPRLLRPRWMVWLSVLAIAAAVVAVAVLL